MINHKEENEQVSGINIFLILFMLLVFVSLKNPERHNSLSGNNDFHSKLIFGSSTSSAYAVTSKAYHFVDVQAGTRESASNKILNNFTFHDLLSEYNHRLDQNNIVIQREQLSIRPGLLWNISYQQVTGDDDVVPVLS
jgi:hypothetical protein